MPAPSSVVYGGILIVFVIKYVPGCIYNPTLALSTPFVDAPRYN